VKAEVVRQGAARRELAAALAQVGEAQDGIDQIVVGRKLQRDHARDPERGAKLGLFGASAANRWRAS
jgi:hypothetical protein